MQLKASTRDLLGKRSRRLHGEGKLAAVVYGHNTKPTPLVLERLEFQKVFLKSGPSLLPRGDSGPTLSAADRVSPSAVAPAGNAGPESFDHK